MKASQLFTLKSEKDNSRKRMWLLESKNIFPLIICYCYFVPSKRSFTAGKEMGGEMRRMHREKSFLVLVFFCQKEHVKMLAAAADLEVKMEKLKKRLQSVLF